jgi:hypothetical protein
MSLRLPPLETDEFEPTRGKPVLVLGALGTLDTCDAAVRVEVAV